MKKRYALTFESSREKAVYLKDIFEIDSSQGIEDFVSDENIVTVIFINTEKSKDEIESDFREIQRADGKIKIFADSEEKDIQCIYLIGAEIGPKTIFTRKMSVISLEQLDPDFNVEIVDPSK